MNKTFYQNQLDNLEQNMRELFERVENLEKLVEYFRTLELNGVVVSDNADRPIYLYNHQKQT